LVRYCFGGGIAGRLGSTDLVNTVVIAHPSNLKPAQIRAIKVNPSRMVCPSHDSLTCLLRSLLLGRWPKVKNITVFFFRCALHLLLHIADDHGFKDEDVKTAEGIFKEQEEKPDHVDYEFRVYKGKFLLAMRTHLVHLNPDDA
jgi:dienelactone hydrolase